ncbi:MAG TPA: nicotinate phosphoribosyltransferase [Terriglobia bacterium]|nr:nicotinate phosphoribosyltransferase [Terriglobia bacterium]
MRDASSSILLTDLYMLTMLEAFHRQSMHGMASYEFFVRKLPENRGFLVAAGLEQVLQYLENAHFAPEELDWLRRTGRFSPDFIHHLARWRFAGDVDAMPEGTIFFANEPVLRITAPISQAQLVESRLVNLLNFQTMIASKATRCVLAADKRTLVDFGLRRAHGAEAGLLASRASYLSGFDGTATVLAGMLFDIPIYGTMAHAYVLAHEDEQSAFESFARAQPANVVLLIDTYDTANGARIVVDLAPRLQQSGIAVKAVRVDSGDPYAEAQKVRRILDEGGLHRVGIFCSGNLDEVRVRDLVQANAPITGFGIGTRLDTSEDAPSLESVYKLVEYEGKPRRKHSEAKATWPGRKQVFRQYTIDGRMQWDTVTVEGNIQEGQPLLEPVLRGGNPVRPADSLSRIRERCTRQLAQLPEHLRALGTEPIYEVRISAELTALARQTDEAIFSRKSSVE